MRCRRQSRGQYFPHRIIAGNEPGDAGDDAERLAHRVDVDTGTGAFGDSPFIRCANAAGKLDHLEAAPECRPWRPEGSCMARAPKIGELS